MSSDALPLSVDRLTESFDMLSVPSDMAIMSSEAVTVDLDTPDVPASSCDTIATCDAPTLSSDDSDVSALSSGTVATCNKPASSSDARVLSSETAVFSSDTPNLPVSINQVLRQNSRKRLYLHPLAWTADQPRLLGFYFHKEQAETTAVDTEHSYPGYKYADALSRLNDYLKFVCGWKTKGYLGAPQTTYYFPFYFGGTPKATIGVEIIFLDGGNDNLPCLAFVDKATIATARECKATRRGGRISHKKIVTPSDPTEDPYLVATLIALAQRQKKKVTKSQYDVNLIHTNKRPVAVADEFMHFYHASIPASLLDRLDRPKDTFESEPGVKIVHFPLMGALDVSGCYIEYLRNQIGQYMDVPEPKKLDEEPESDNEPEPGSGHSWFRYSASETDISKRWGVTPVYQDYPIW